jgi:hypothetical protein
MRITSTGAVGIGTATPGARLEVGGGDATIYGVTVGRGGGNRFDNTDIKRSHPIRRDEIIQQMDINHCNSIRMDFRILRMVLFLSDRIPVDEIIQQMV